MTASLKHSFIISIVCFFSFFIHLDSIPVNNLMEARNLVTAREVFQNNTYIIPTMNGNPRLEKPPLPTWLTTLSMTIANTHKSLLFNRLPVALCASLLVFFIYGLSLTLTRSSKTAFITSLIFATFPHVIEYGRQNFWDIYVHTFMAGGLWFFLNAVKKSQDWRYFIYSGILMGLSIMSKGPVGYFSLFTPFFISWILFLNGWKVLKSCWKKVLVSHILAIAIGLIWPMLVYLDLQSTLTQVVNKEAGGWTNRHVYPWTFYLHFIVFTGIWISAGLSGFAVPYIKNRLPKLGTFLLSWAGITVTLLTLMPHKQIRYLFPIWIPIALLIGALWDYFLKDSRIKTKADQVILVSHTLVCGLFTIAALVIIKKTGLSAILFFYFSSFLGLFLFSIYRKKISCIFYITIILNCSIIAFLFPSITQLTQGNYRYNLLEKIPISSPLNSLPLYTTHPNIPLQYVYYAEKEIRPLQLSEIPTLVKKSDILVLSWDSKFILPQKLTTTVTTTQTDKLTVHKNGKHFWILTRLSEK